MRHNIVKIGASVICMDPLCIELDVHEALAAGVDYLHVDVMDGSRVPRLGLYPELIKGLIDLKLNVPIDVHLMVRDPLEIIRQLDGVGVRPTSISFHVDERTAFNVLRIIDAIVDMHATPGVVITLAQLSAIHDWDVIRTREITLVTLMGTHPGVVRGFSRKRGDTLNAGVREIRELSSELMIQIDGGVRFETLHALYDAGANYFVCGSATIYSSADVAENVHRVREALSCTTS